VGDQRAELWWKLGIAPHVPTRREGVDGRSRNGEAARDVPLTLFRVAVRARVPQDALRGIAQRRAARRRAVVRCAYGHRDVDLVRAWRALRAASAGGDTCEVVPPAVASEEERREVHDVSDLTREREHAGSAC